jgi:hypothetical protein
MTMITPNTTVTNRTVHEAVLTRADIEQLLVHTVLAAAGVPEEDFAKYTPTVKVAIVREGDEHYLLNAAVTVAIDHANPTP